MSRHRLPVAERAAPGPSALDPARRASAGAARPLGARAAGAALLAGLILAAPGARAQDPAAPAPRPAAKAYVVVDGVSVPRPLGDAQGEAARGRAVFDDPRLGGCRACHAAPGLPRAVFVPDVLADGVAPPAPGAATDEAGAGGDGTEAAAEAASAQAPAASESDSARAPRAAPPPPPRPEIETAEADAGTGDPDGDGATDGAGDGSGDGAGGADAPGVAAVLLPLPQGPDLAGVGARLPEGELRLLVINPRIAREASRMPAYHNVSLARAALVPALRQPWLSAQEVEDLVAYLATLTDPAASEPAGEVAPPAAGDQALPGPAPAPIDGSAATAPAGNSSPADAPPPAAPAGDAGTGAPAGDAGTGAPDVPAMSGPAPAEAPTGGPGGASGGTETGASGGGADTGK